MHYELERLEIYKLQNVVGKLEWKGSVEELRVDGNMILKWILKKQVCDSVDWIGMAEGRDRWRALVNTAMYS
jgi:hypothetical protein